MAVDYPRVTFTEPAPRGYIYVGKRVAPPHGAPFVRASAERKRVLEECKRAADRLKAVADVVAVAVYEAVLMPPAKDHPRFDVLVLVQTTSPQAIAAVEGTEAFQGLNPDFVMPARNIRRIGDIDGPGPAQAFLFNHFTSSDAERALRTFEDVAGWFTHKARVKDSALLGPISEAPYVFVNHVRLPGSPFQFFLSLLKPSFRRSVSRKLKADRIGFAAVVCRPVP